MKHRLMGILLMAIFLLSLGGTAAVFASDASGEWEGEYRIQGYDNNSGDYIVSKYNVKDYGATGDGETDDTAAFTSLLSDLRRSGEGATVFVPAGKYRITRTLSVPANVHLRGQWNDPSKGTTGPETVLIADLQPLDEEWTTAAPPQGFINLNAHATVRDFVIYYPGQDPDDIQIYPYAVQANAHNVNVQNLTLVNAYYGINMGVKDKGSSHVVKNIYGTVLKRGVNIDYNYSDGVVMNLSFSADFWKDYSGLTEEQTAAVKAFTKANATALYIGKNDDYGVINIDCDADEYREVFSVNHNPDVNDTSTGTPPMGYGVAMGLNGASTIMNMPEDYNQNGTFPMPMDVDGIAGSEQYVYELAPDRFSTRAKIFNVKDYGATGAEGNDATFALAAALEEAGKNGGGIVYLPAGIYRVSAPLTIPENVELLGESWDIWMGEATRIEINWGIGRPDDAFLTLSAGSGIQGVSFHTVGFSQETIKQTIETQEDCVPEYSWVIRGAGANVWVENVEFYNVRQGIDFASAACDNFVVNGVYGTVVGQGARFGGGSKGGRIENVQIGYSLWFEGEGRYISFDDFRDYSGQYMNGLEFLDCSEIVAFNIGGFGLKNSAIFREQDGKGPENMIFYKILADSPTGDNGVLVEAGDNMTMLGLSTGVGTKMVDGVMYGTLLNVTETFDGKIRVLVQNTWSSANNAIAEGADVEIYRENEQEVDLISHEFSSVEFPGLDDDPNGPEPTEPTVEVPEDRTLMFTLIFVAVAAVICAGTALALRFGKKKAE